MRILFFGNRIEEQDVQLNFLSTIAERESIYFVYDFAEFVDFIENRIIKLQEVLDLIVVQENEITNKEEQFSLYLNRDIQRTYSNRDFNFYKIPVILLLEENQSINFYSGKGYAGIIEDLQNDEFFKSKNVLVSGIKGWRRRVLGELDNLGIEFNSGRVNFEIYLKRWRKGDITKRTEILAENFQMFPRHLKYSWMYENAKQIEIAIDNFIGLLKHSEQFPKRQEEKKFHHFFKQNPFFLERDNFSRHWHEAKLKLVNQKKYEPDFTLEPNLNYESDLSLIEVKLPNENIIKKADFHKTFLGKVFQHIDQVHNYKEYLEDRSNYNSIKRVFGFVPDRVNYNILIGRSAHKEENADHIKKASERYAKSIHLMTYDELMEYQVQYLYRMNLLKIS
jgi:hypothetical protein